MSSVSYKYDDKMIFPFWLVFTSGGDVRMTRKHPGNLSANERAVSMTAELPLSLWRVPSLSATIKIDHDPATAEVNIDLKAAAEALRSSLGVDIDLRIVDANTADSL